MQALLKMENVDVFIPGDIKRPLALKNISLEVHVGQHLAIYGPNGAGKTTLLRLMHGELWPARGHIFWLNEGIAEDSPIIAKSISALVSPLVQENCQRMAWHISVRAMLQNGIAGESLAFNRADDTAAQKRIDALLQKLHASELADMRLPELSQGQLRIVLLAMAILRKPALLLLDEWTEGLDREHRQIFSAVLAELGQSTTMVFASHRANGIPQWVRKAVFIEEGQISRKPAHPPASVRIEPVSETVPIKKRDYGKVLLNLENVSVYVDRQLVLKDINWQIRQGQNWRISGPNGSGKSTLLRLLAGREFAYAGGIMEFYAPDGSQLQTYEGKARNFALISDLSQARYSYNLTALELVCSGYDESEGLYREFSDAERAGAMRVIDFFFAETANIIAGTLIRRLSSGQLRKLFLARALVRRPAVLLLDEAFSGLDALSRANFIHSLDVLALSGLDGWRPQLVFVSHYEEDAPLCLNCEAVMDRGRLYIKQADVRS